MHALTLRLLETSGRVIRRALFCAALALPLVFHGAYASALARGERLGDRLRLASAAAALKAMRSGGQAGIPDLTAVSAFLRDRIAHPASQLGLP